MKRKKESEEATRELCMTVEMEEMDPLDKDRKKQQPHKRKPGGGERERERERERDLPLGAEPLTLCYRL